MTAHVVSGDDAGGVAAYELKLHTEPSESIQVLCLKSTSCFIFFIQSKYLKFQYNNRETKSPIINLTRN